MTSAGPVPVRPGGATVTGAKTATHGTPESRPAPGRTETGERPKPAGGAYRKPVETARTDGPNLGKSPPGKPGTTEW
ncbi:hypothetical protein GCM10023107_19140 [Actinoplanes octamycinicus]|nr:hypothetical protein Aoc01nite_59180 [Actinoplanes octamycinicus]